MPIHTIPPVYDECCHTLVLGSFPSVKSREAAFFYGHPQNRFWKVLAAVFEEPVPAAVEEKKAFLLRHHIALWDVIASCEITGSGDASIRGAVPNDLSPILAACSIRRVFTNGGTAHTLYKKFLLPVTGIDDTPLPSTSPANASFTLEKLVQRWNALREEKSCNP